MKAWQTALFSAGALGAAGAAVWYVLYRKQQTEIPPGVVGPQGSISSGSRMPASLVQNRERARNAHPALQSFLDWWQVNGPFPILVAPDGGLRTDAAKQASYYAQGMSKAKTLAETPHGRGAALDLWPVGFDPAKKLEQQEDIKEKFKEMGRIAKASPFNFTWGGDWGWDYPHIEVKGWKNMPYPPKMTAPNLAGVGALDVPSAGSGAAVALIAAGIAFWLMSESDDESPNPERECEAAAKRWKKTCVLEKVKARKGSTATSSPASIT